MPETPEMEESWEHALELITAGDAAICFEVGQPPATFSNWTVWRIVTKLDRILVYDESGNVRANVPKALFLLGR